MITVPGAEPGIHSPTRGGQPNATLDLGLRYEYTHRGSTPTHLGERVDPVPRHDANMQNLAYHPTWCIGTNDLYEGTVLRRANILGVAASRRSRSRRQDELRRGSAGPGPRPRSGQFARAGHLLCRTPATAVRYGAEPQDAVVTAAGVDAGPDARRPSGQWDHERLRRGAR
jgi:hypothetical protein